MRTQFSINQITLLGNIVNEPEIKRTQSDTLILQFNMVTNRSIKTSDGNYEDKSTFHRVVCIGKGAEWISQKLKKGHKVMVMGRQENRSYETKEGEKKYISEVVADSITPLFRIEPKDNAGDNDKDDPETNDVADDVPF